MSRAEVQTELLTKEERYEFSKLLAAAGEREHRRAKELAWSVTGAVFVGTAVWVHANEYGSPGYQGWQSLMWGLCAAVMSAVFVFIGAPSVVEFFADRRPQPWLDEWLDSVDYAARVAKREEARAHLTKQRLAQEALRQSRGSSIGDNSAGRSYPVTAGEYDPVLYAQRGGRDTYHRMRASGIDDYETYKNNVEEAE